MRQRVAVGRLLVLVMTLALAASACAGGEGDAPGAGGTDQETAAADGTPDGDGEPSGEPIRIGASLPLTGQFSTPASKHELGYQLCVDQINERGGLLDRPVELAVQDNRSDTEVAVSQYEEFVSGDNVDLLFGSFSSLLTFPTSVVAEEAGMVYPVPSGGALPVWSRGFENIFYFQQDAAEYVASGPVNMLEHYRDEGVIPEGEFPETAAVVHVNDFFFNAVANGLLGNTIEMPDGSGTIDLSPGILQEAGIEVVFEEQYPTEYDDWLQLAQSIQESGADAVFAGTLFQGALDLMRALESVGYEPDVLYMAQGAQLDFGENLGSSANGVIAHSSWHPEAEWEGVINGEPYSNEQFIEDFNAANDQAPDEDAAIPFALCQGMAQAVQATGTTDNAEIRSWLDERTAEEPAETIMGDFYWDEDGLPAGRDHLVTQWQDGELQFIYPTGEFEGVTDVVFPKPGWSG